MKNKYLLLAILFTLQINLLRGAELTWDNGTASGLWNTTDANWSGASLWDNATPDSAIFDTLGVGAVTVIAPIAVDSITFNTAGYTLAGGPITLSGPLAVSTITANAAATISSVLDGATALVKNGSEALTLSGANTFLGGVTLSSGTITANNDQALGAGTLQMAGGLLRSDSGIRIIANPVHAMAATSSALLNNSGSGDMILTGAITGTGTLSINSTVSRSFWFQGDGSGFAGTVEYTNNNNGTNLRLGGGPGTLVNTSTNGSDWSGTRFVLSGATGNNRGLIWNGAAGTTVRLGSIEGVGRIGVTSSAVRWEVGALNTITTYSGSIDLAGSSLRKVGTGTLKLAGSSSYGGGTVVSKGNLHLSNSAALGTGTLTLGDADTGSDNISVYLVDARTNLATPIIVSALAGGTVTLGSAASIGGSTDNNQFVGITLNRDVIFDSNAADRTDYENITGVGNIRVIGSGRSNFPTVAGWVGNVVVATTGGGSMQIGVANTAGDRIPDTSTLTIEAGGLVRLSATAETVASLNGSGGLTANSPAGGTGTLTVGFGGASGSHTGVISNGAGTFVIRKIGAGTQSLGGASTYTGGTILSSGTLEGTVNAAFGTGTITIGDAETGSQNTTLTLKNRADIPNAILVSTNGTGSVVIGADNSGSGANSASFIGTMTLNRPTTLRGGVTSDRLAVNGQITGDVELLTVDGGSRTSFFSVANNFTGDVLVTGSGTILQASVGSEAEVIPNTASVTINAGAILQLASLGGATETINGLNGAGLVRTFPTSALGGGLTVGAANGDGNFSGTLQNGFAPLHLTKVGTGTQTLSGPNTYTGTTLVQGGTLLINGSHTGGGLITVDPAGTLGGIGSVGDVSVLDAGTLAPGLSAGTFIVGNLSFSSLARMEFELGAPNQGSAPGDSDYVFVQNSLVLGGELHLSALPGFGTPTIGDTWVLFDYAPSFLTDTGLTIASAPAGVQFEIDTASVSGQVLLRVVIPEPSSLFMVLLGAAVLVRMRRYIA